MFPIYLQLISKLRAYGISGKILDWIKDFLQYRKQQVGVRKELSNWADVMSGVPQLLYVNDLPEVVTSTTNMFADDTKLYNRVKKDSSEGSDAIQDDLNQLKDWSDTWLLRFNASKCKCIHLGNDNPDRSYVLGDDEIVVAKEEKDLGVYITDDCKASMQCTKAAKKAMPSLRIIKRTFKYIQVLDQEWIWGTKRLKPIILTHQI
ncbi:uncharacterized protein [Amphiura filiformis]|uniref:uncharacterized protein n=1 Tax=Amphiura filiformis TaxID=82378 RepID=UPI003B215EBE